LAGGFVLSEDEKKERIRIFENHRDEINKRQLSNSESFDKAMLSLSSAGLALSLSFIKFIVPLDKIEQTFFLYATWWLFGLTIILTIVSLLVSQKALDNTLKYAEKYYLANDPNYFNKKDKWDDVTNWLNRVPAVTFILAIISVIIFTTQNFQINEKGENIMSNENQQLNEGAKVPSMQKVNIEKGANIPKMQPTQPSENTQPTLDKKEE